MQLSEMQISQLTNLCRCFNFKWPHLRHSKTLKRGLGSGGTFLPRPRKWLRWNPPKVWIREIAVPDRLKFERSSIKRESVIVSDPEIMGGTPCFRGTRVPVDSLIDYLEAGNSLAEFLDNFPSVSREATIARSRKRRRLSPARDEDTPRRESASQVGRTSGAKVKPRAAVFDKIRTALRVVFDAQIAYFMSSRGDEQHIPAWFHAAHGAHQLKPAGNATAALAQAHQPLSGLMITSGARIGPCPECSR